MSARLITHKTIDIISITSNFIKLKVRIKHIETMIYNKEVKKLFLLFLMPTILNAATKILPNRRVTTKTIFIVASS